MSRTGITTETRGVRDGIWGRSFCSGEWLRYVGVRRHGRLLQMCEASLGRLDRLRRPGVHTRRFGCSHYSLRIQNDWFEWKSSS
ncbi:hypothetical protein GCM10027063_04850 [Promicromonospora xylanilytica]